MTSWCLVKEGLVTVGTLPDSPMGGLSISLVTSVDIWMTDVIIVNMAGDLHGVALGSFLPLYKMLLCRLSWEQVFYQETNLSQ